MPMPFQTGPINEETARRLSAMFTPEVIAAIVPAVEFTREEYRRLGVIVHALADLEEEVGVGDPEGGVHPMETALIQGSLLVEAASFAFFLKHLFPRG